MLKIYIDFTYMNVNIMKSSEYDEFFFLQNIGFCYLSDYGANMVNNDTDCIFITNF